MTQRVIWFVIVMMITFIIASGFAARMYANGLDSPLLIILLYLYFGLGGVCVALREPWGWS